MYMKFSFYLSVFLITAFTAAAQKNSFQTVVSVSHSEFLAMPTGTKVLYKQYCNPEIDSVITNGVISYQNRHVNGIVCKHILHFKDTVLQRQYLVVKKKKDVEPIIAAIDPAGSANGKGYNAFWKSLPKGWVLSTDKTDYIIFKTASGWVVEF